MAPTSSGDAARVRPARGDPSRTAPSAACAQTVWLTGLSGAGKTTLALTIERELRLLKWPTCLLDGDDLRKGLSSDLGLERADRAEQSRRAAHVAALLSGSGIVAIVALVSPYAEDRSHAQAIHHERGLPFFEVWVDTPLEVCERRDTKGLYARARSGELRGLTGLDAPYEPPDDPDLRVAGYGEAPTVGARRLVALLAAAGGRDLRATGDRPGRCGKA